MGLRPRTRQAVYLFTARRQCGLLDSLVAEEPDTANMASAESPRNTGLARAEGLLVSGPVGLSGGCLSVLRREGVGGPERNAEEAETRRRTGKVGRFLARAARAKNVNGRLPGTRCAAEEQAKWKDMHRMAARSIHRDAAG